MCVRSGTNDGEILTSSLERSSYLIVASIISLIQGSVNNQDELTKKSLVEFATETKVLKELFNESCEEVRRATMESIKNIYLGVLEYFSDHTMADHASGTSFCMT